MKKQLTFVFLIFTIYSFSQVGDLPRNAKPGECYIKCVIRDFDYNKKYKGSSWEEISCDSLKKRYKKKIIYEKSVRCAQDRIKMIKYKEKLVALGYDIKVDVEISNEFIKAHNKYIKNKKREDRKRRKNKI